jgi:hypothetical protein
MRRKFIFTLIALVLLGSPLMIPGQVLAEEQTQFFPILAYRTANAIFPYSGL